MESAPQYAYGAFFLPRENGTTSAAPVAPSDSFEKKKATVAAVKDLKRSVPDWEQRVVWIVLACSDYSEDIGWKGQRCLTCAEGSSGVITAKYEVR